jgi:hypothetical protein
MLSIDRLRRMPEMLTQGAWGTDIQPAAAFVAVTTCCRYDDAAGCHVSGWCARDALHCLVDAQVTAAVARSIAGKPCAALQHLSVNMETLSAQPYPEGWWGRVAAALQLSTDQRAVLKAAWSKAAADRASLLAQHETLSQQLLEMQQQQAARQQDFGQRVQKASERCVVAMQKQALHSMQSLLVPAATAAAATAPCFAGMSGAFSISSGGFNNNPAAAAAAAHTYRSSTPCCSGSSSSTVSTASAAAGMPGVTWGNQQLLQQQPAGSNSSGAAATPAVAIEHILSLTCAVDGPDAPSASSSAPLRRMAQPEVLLCAPRPGQQQLQQKLAAVRASLGLLYSWCSLVAYNTLSRKQLAVGAVTSYPFAFDPVAGKQLTDV